MNKKTLYSYEAREKLLSGINKITDAVAVTLGPSGRNVLIGHSVNADYGVHSLPNEVTKDGYRVTQRFGLDDFSEKAGVELVKECAERTVSQAGDGTTSTCVLMRHMVVSGLNAIAAGENPMQLKRAIDAAVARVVSILKTMAIKIEKEDHEKVLQIAMIAANNDPEIGQQVADAFKKIGHEGVVDIQSGISVKTEVKTAAGYRFGESWVHPLFINRPEKQTVEFDDPLILLYNRVITSHKQYEKVFEIVTNAQKPLLIICPDAQDEGLNTLVLNNLRKTIKVCIVKSPGLGDAQRLEMEDIAILTGATYMADNRGEDIKEIQPKHFGRAKKVLVTKEETIIIDGQGDEERLKDLLLSLRLQRSQAKNEDEAAPIEKRIAKLTGGVAVIQVGAATETEMKEKMDRFDDSVRAVKSAIAEGYAVGAGTALLRAHSGNSIVDSALDMVLRQICANAGLKPRRWWQFWKEKYIFDQVKNASGNIGYNAKTGQIEDLIEAGVVDPVKVLRCALQNAASSATMVLTTEALIVDCF
jgi:chaperonin GroEL